MTNPFQPLGPAPINDPFMARLDRAKPWGSGQATGAVNSLALAQDPRTKDGTLYAGSVNGGLWGRNYDATSDSWGTWSWLSQGNGYEGAQSISQIKVLDDPRWLVSATGKASSFSGLSGQLNNPLQVAERQADGSLRWIRNNPTAQRPIFNTPITALETSGNVVVIGTGNGLYVSSVDGNGTLAPVRRAGRLAVAGDHITSLTRGAGGRLYAGVLGQGIFMTTEQELRANPGREWKLIPGSEELARDKIQLRLSTHVDPASGLEVLYAGSGAAIPSLKFGGYDLVHRISVDRRVNRINQLQSADVVGQIGTDQVFIHASFAADPSNPNRVFAGGNSMTTGVFNTNSRRWDPATPGAFNGGLSAVVFDGDQTAIEKHYTSYSDPKGADGTAPHADSRAIVFLTKTDNSMHIIESDDGGIYTKEIDPKSPWRPLNDGLRTTESFTADWSHIGNLAMTAMQDNSVAAMRYDGQRTWHNLTGGDGAIARFDDGIKGSENLSRGYYTGQQYYFGNGIIQASTFDPSGKLLENDYLSLDIADQYGNWQSFGNYDISYYTSKKINENTNYPFYWPIATSPYRAGDVVITGARNIYEQIVPFWHSPVSGEMKLIPLIEDDPNKHDRFFTDVAIGSTQGLDFGDDKPDSWDTVYTSFVTRTAQGKRFSQFFGRPAQNNNNTSWFDNPDLYRLKDLSAKLPDIAKENVITGIAFNRQNPDQIWLTIAEESIAFGVWTKISSNPFNPSSILYSPDGGFSWSTVAQSGTNGIPANAGLQQIIAIPTKADPDQLELYVSGYGGVWKAKLNADGTPERFHSVDWEGLEDNAQFNFWITDLEHDAVDDVVIASVMGQGTWLHQRTDQPLHAAPAMEPGLRISQLMLPQDINNYRTRKGRSVEGSIKVELERDASNQDLDVSVDMLLSDDWKQYIEIQENNWPHFQNITDNKITLNFPKGINALSFFVNTKTRGINLPDKVINLSLSNPTNSTISDAVGSVYLYATGHTIYLLQEAPGVFYSTETAQALSGDKLITIMPAQGLAILMPNANLSPGQTLSWYPVDSDGAIVVTGADGVEQRITVDDPSYITEASKLFKPMATASGPYDPRAFSPAKAVQAFTNPAAVLESEGIPFGELTTSIGSGLVEYQGRFAFALTDADGQIRVSPRGLSLDVDARLDNVVNFGTPGQGTQVVMAPALGELFVVDDSFESESNRITAGKLKFDLDVANFGQANSGFGLFRVDDPYGNFLFVDGQIKIIQPGSPEYTSEAIKRALSNGVDGITGLPVPAFGSSSTTPIELAVGNAYGLYITPGHTIQSSTEAPDPSSILFSIANANSNQQLQHVSMGTNYFSFEETLLSDANRAQQDFNDLMFYLQPQGSATLLA